MWHPLFNKEALGFLCLDQPAYSKPKGVGDHSMPVKREAAGTSLNRRSARSAWYGQGYTA